MKLIGYYFLGGFRININELALPVGFATYFLAFRPGFNRSAKRWAVIWGLSAFLISSFLPQLSNTFQFTHKVPVSNLNLYSGSIVQDWIIIQKNQDLPQQSGLEDFEVCYEKSGLIRELRYQITGYKNGKLKHYSIELLPMKKEYRITESDVDQWAQYDRLIDSERFFKVFSNLKLNEMIPNKREYQWLVMRCDGERVSYAIKDNERFYINGTSFVRIPDSQLPVEGYYISSYGMVKEKEDNAGSFQGLDYQDYFFD